MERPRIVKGFAPVFFVLTDAEKIIRKIVEKTGMSRSEVEERIRRKIKEFAGLLTEAGAAYAVAKELGIEVDVERELTQRVKIKDLKPGMEHVDLIARVLRIFPPRVFRRDGRFGRYCKLIIGDETGTARLTLWHRDVNLVERGQIERGTVIEIINGYVTEFNGNLNISLGFDGRIIINPDDPDVEKLPPAEKPLVKVSDLSPEMNEVDIVLRVISVFPPRETETKRGKVKYRTLIAGDETGTVRVVLWGDHAEKDIKQGDVVKIEAGYVRERMDEISVHVGMAGNIVVRPDLADSIPEVKIPPRIFRVNIADLEEGDKFREIRGVVVQVYDITPISAFCNVCGSRAEWRDGEWVCPSCESTDIRLVPILSFEIDDGTGTMRVVAFGEPAKTVYGDIKGSGEDLIERARKKLVGREVVISGFVRRNKIFDKPEFVAKTLSFPDPKAELELVIHNVEKLLAEKRNTPTTTL